MRRLDIIINQINLRKRGFKYATIYGSIHLIMHCISEKEHPTMRLHDEVGNHLSNQLQSCDTYNLRFMQFMCDKHNKLQHGSKTNIYLL